MRASKLDHAIVLRDRLKQIDIFLSGYDGKEGWEGPVQLSFGSYQCDVVAYVGRLQLIAVLKVEREGIAGALAELGVEIDDG